MENELRMPSKFYWTYIAGFILIIAQLINVIPPWFIPTDWGKVICFRIILSILAFIFIWQIISKKIDFFEIKNKLKSAGLSLYLLISFFGISFLATIFSLGSHFSLWGNPFRNGGFINLLFYIIFAFMTFLIIREKDWRKIWDFSLFIGIIVSAIAIFQQFGILSKIFIHFESRPMSVMGNTILLAIYLLLLTFPTLSLGLSQKSKLRKAFYFSSALLFIMVIVFLTQTRGVFLGLAAGFLWLFFSYPKKTKLKIYAGIFLVLTILGLYSFKVYLDNHLYVYDKMPLIVSEPLDRGLSIFEGTKIIESRISAWRVSFKALKERPILGYGPENFEIAFNKYYDPTLSGIGQGALGKNVSEWFDRAHNFIFDISVTTGIPALLIYLSFFFVLIYQLQKAKKRKPENTLILNGLQATFVGYLVSLLSGFDSVCTYLVSFLLIGWSFSFISDYQIIQVGLRDKFDNVINKIYKFRIILITALFVLLIWFIWICNILPLKLNKDLNMAQAYADVKMCDKALEITDQVSLLTQNSVIDNFLTQKILTINFSCIDKSTTKTAEDIIKKTSEIFKRTAENYPQYVTNWIYFGEYINIFIEQKNIENNNIYENTDEMEKLKTEAILAFEKAQELSPKRQLILYDWAITYTLTGEYKNAEEKLQQCFDLNPLYPACYWYMALTKGYEKDYESMKNFSNLAEEKGYDIGSEEVLKQMTSMYIRNNDYHGLIEVYPRLILITSDPIQKAQLYASFAASYKELGDIRKAREQVLKINDLIPLMPKDLQQAAINDVASFLEILK